VSFKKLLALSAFCLLATAAPRADAVIVERIVAVVGERPILLSELRHRGKPNLIRILAEKDPNVQAANETEMYKNLLTRMIDERLEEAAAEKARISVTPEEVDRGMQNVANQAHVSVADVLAEVRRTGLSEQDFRDEIRRQILEGKLLELRVRPRVKVTEQDARAAYVHYRSDYMEQHPVELRIVAMRIPAGGTKEAEEAARNGVERARKGEDFCKLVRELSDDESTKGTCGSRGAQPMQMLAPPMQAAIKQMKPGEVSEPIRFGNEAIVFFQLHKFPPVPTYEEVKNEMMQRALIEGLERQRKLWLAELRRGVYIDVRL
jgi:peptidyl-prolyl cis-trans isomerase SurA